jgi:hypothetical protein
MNSYGERLAHGTDQGKWLIQEVDMQKPKKKHIQAKDHFKLVSYTFEDNCAPIVKKKEKKSIREFLYFLFS